MHDLVLLACSVPISWIYSPDKVINKKDKSYISLFKSNFIQTNSTEFNFPIYSKNNFMNVKNVKKCLSEH